MKFQYIALDRSGARLEGELDSDCRASALRTLASQQLTPIELNVDSGAGKKSALFGIGQQADLAHVTREIARMLERGIRLDEALMLLADALPGRMASALGEIGRAVRGGSPLHQALGAFPQLFPPLYRQTVRIGESSGQLATVFGRLADELAFQKQMKAEIRQAMAYPGFVLLVCVLSVVFIFNVIVPQLRPLFDGIEPLPAYTRMFLAFSDAFVVWQGWIFGGLLAGISALVYFRDSEWVQQLLSHLQEHTPGIRQLFLTLDQIRIASAMGMLLTCKLALTEALALTVESASLKRVRQAMQYILQQVRGGTTPSKALQQAGLFSQLDLAAIRVGEQSAGLDDAFMDLAERYRSRFKEQAQTLARLVEPILIVFLGLVVGAVVIVLLLSIMSVNEVGI